MQIFDMSSVHQMYGVDKSYNLNFSIYLGTIYLNVFKDKKLLQKLNVTQSFHLLMCELLDLFIAGEGVESKFELGLEDKTFDPETRKFYVKKAILFRKDAEANKYKPYTLTIIDDKSKLNCSFTISGPNYALTKNGKSEYGDPAFALKYLRHIFYNKISPMVTLSYEKELMDKRKKTHYK